MSWRAGGRIGPPGGSLGSLDIDFIGIHLWNLSKVTIGLTVRCRGTQSNRSGFGVRAALTIEFPDGQRQTLHRGAGSLSSFGGSPHDSLHFGIPASARPVELRIHWPCSDVEQKFSGLEVSTTIEVMEGKSEFLLREAL